MSDFDKAPTLKMLARLAVGSVLIFSGCTTTSQNPMTAIELKELQAKFAEEPYPVLLVDRTKFGPLFQPTIVPAPEKQTAGTILIDTRQRLLYLFEADGKARRYGVAVGASGHTWYGTATVGRMAKWPAWFPTDDMRNGAPGLPRRIEPGTHNPLGARALYLYKDGQDTLLRVHGSSEPWTIGTEASSGCIRMLNEDVIDLYARVKAGARVIVR